VNTINIRCPGCGERMKVTHTFQQENGCVRRLWCQPCLQPLTEVQLYNPGHGYGAAALARAWEANGQAPLLAQ
jgi:hypothetical protein